MTGPVSEPRAETRRFEILLFGPQARLAGADRVAVDLSERPTVREVLAALAEIESLRASLGSSRLAVNHEYAAPDEVIEPDSELALIGLVSGG